MTSEISLYFESETAYRHIENMAVTSSGALKKRAGTRLVLFSQQEIFMYSTSEHLYVFFADNTYKVYDNADFHEVKHSTSLPADLLFRDLKKGSIQATFNDDTPRILIATKAGIFEQDTAFDFLKQTLQDLPSGVEPTIFLILPGRSVIAYGNSLYFSKYNDLYNFTPVDPASKFAAEGAYILDLIVGVDRIVDIIFFKNQIFLGTKTAVFQIKYGTVNPFADSAAQNFELNISKIFSDGIATRNFENIGNYVVFANNRGIYGIQVSSTILSGGSISSVSQSVVLSLAASAEHILQGDRFKVVDISSYFRKENVFFILRDDGIIFKCMLDFTPGNVPVLNVTRFLAGEVETLRKYFQMDREARYFVTKRGATFFLEMNNEYPYLRDNKLVFSWHEDLKNLRNFAFLDCFKKFSILFFSTAKRLTDSTIQFRTTLIVGNQYYFWDKIAGIYGSFEVLSKNFRVYTISAVIKNDIILLGKRLSMSDIDISDFNRYSEGQQLYLTYVNLNFYPFRTETVKLNQSTSFDSFFAVCGFGYEGTMEIFLNFEKNPDSVNPMKIRFFDCEKMEFIAYTEEGLKRSVSSEHKMHYRNSTESLILPTVEFKEYENFDVKIPVGYSGCVLSLG